MIQKETQILIGQGKTKKAIQHLIDCGNEDMYNAAIVLMGRWNRLQSNSTLGTISNQDILLETNKINFAVLSLLGIDPSDETFKITQKPNSSFETQLLQIIKDNQRSSPDLANEAQELLKVLRTHNDKKELDSYYDLTGRRFDEIVSTFVMLEAKIMESKKDKVENFAEQIKKLLSARIPSYDSLQKAYVLCVGRGFNSQYVKNTLELQPDDNESKFKVIDELEKFVLTNSKK